MTVSSDHTDRLILLQVVDGGAHRGRSSGLEHPAAARVLLVAALAVPDTFN